MCAVRAKDSGSVLHGSEAPLEGALVPPDPPGDASDAIGEGDGGNVVAPCLGGTKGPDLERIGLPGPLLPVTGATGLP